MRAPARLRCLRAIAAALLLAAGGCARGEVSREDVAAVYEAFLKASEGGHQESVLLQDSTMPVEDTWFREELPGTRLDARFWSAEVHEAIRDLAQRSRNPVRLPPQVKVLSSQRRISPDSARKLAELIRARELRLLPDSAVVIQFSDVGFSRDRTVAVVVEDSFCGSLCGGSLARVVRRHPGGWIAAEELFFVIY